MGRAGLRAPRNLRTRHRPLRTAGSDRTWRRRPRTSRASWQNRNLRQAPSDRLRRCCASWSTSTNRTAPAKVTAASHNSDFDRKPQKDRGRGAPGARASSSAANGVGGTDSQGNGRWSDAFRFAVCIVPSSQHLAGRFFASFPIRISPRSNSAPGICTLHFLSASAQIRTAGNPSRHHCRILFLLNQMEDGGDISSRCRVTSRSHPCSRKSFSAWCNASACVECGRFMVSHQPSRR